MSSSFRDFNTNLIKDLRANGGKPSGGPFYGRDMIILTTKGAKSGEIRENPLVYTRDDGRYVVVASKGGAPTNPSWFHNLQANPIVTAEINGEK
ncbi:MAG: nitroreductase family deazaflavin-dependent oxidoreductase, partial [Chloroflexi bacterium]